MRFLSFVEHFPDFNEVYGGEHIRPYELGMNLTRMGHEVRIWEVRRPGCARTVAGCDVRPIELPKAKSVRELLMASTMLRVLSKEVDAAREDRTELCLYQRIPMGLSLKAGLIPIVHVPALPLFPVARMMGAQVWAGMHDLAPDHQSEMTSQRETIGIRPNRSSLRAASLEAVQQNLAMRFSSFVTVVSHRMKHEVQRRNGLADKVHIFPSGVNPEVIGAIRAWSHPKPGQTWNIGYVGNGWDASLKLLVEAVEQVASQHPVRLVFGGVGTDRIQRPASLPVDVKPGITYSQFGNFAEDIDLWVVPYDTPYYLNLTWPLKIPMYVASGRPVITTLTTELERSGLLPFVFSTGTTPSTIAESIKGVLNCPERAGKIASAGRDFVLSNLTWRMIIGNLIQSLEGRSWK